MRRYLAEWTKKAFVWRDSWCGSGRTRRSQNRLRLEPLEGRCVPTTITPMTFADGGSGSGS